MKTVLKVHGSIERSKFCCFIGLERLNTYTFVAKYHLCKYIHKHNDLGAK